MTKQGKVYLIGAGPGDPGLLSIKAMECLQTADAVVYDRLADPRILAYAKDDAEMVYVGKASANHTMRQPDINKLLVKLAAEGKTVARLKGGDPFVFGRGGEEAIELLQKKQEAEAQKHIKKFEEEPELEILNGRYGPYIAYKGSNYKIPKDIIPQDLNLQACLEIVKLQSDKDTGKSKRTAKAVKATKTTKTTAKATAKTSKTK